MRHPDEIQKNITKDTQDIEHDDLKCFFCEETPMNIFYQYVANLYMESALYDQLKHNEMSISEESIICEKCHKYLKSKCEVKCVLCERMRAKKDTYLFNRKRYKSIPSDNEKWNEILIDKNRRQYICKMCHTDIQTQFKCVCCKLKYDTHLCKDYNSTDYDFTHFIVSRCLQYVDSEVQSYICLSCHRGLQKTNDENPIVPYYVNDKAITTAAKFLKSLQDKPEYVCTCCHHLLFKNTVKLFNIDRYDMDNYIVKKCLSYRYRMKIFKYNIYTGKSQYKQHEWLNTNQMDSDTDCEYMDEYICIQCSTSLQCSKPRIPDQACANQLNLDSIPQDLSELSTIERRLISYRLPFITLIAMRKYGGHYKVNGPPVNVPAKLDQIVEMLPQMPNELQLVPLKLKCKLEYKTYYMYDTVCKDHIIGALTWLKNHNHLYMNIQINYNWYSSVPEQDIPEILLSGDKVEESQNHHNKRQNIICATCEHRSSHKSTEDTSYVMMKSSEKNSDIAEDYSELVEDQIALEQKENLTGDVLPSVLQYEEVENAIFQCAPAQNNIPRYVLLDDQFELLAFPDLFPLA